MSKCLICGTEIKPFLSFGEMPIANGFLSKEQFQDEYFFELSVAYCPVCHMVQLTELVDREKMFNENYAYFASTSKYMCEHFKKLAYHIQEKYLADNAFVVEIGSNDGIMLQNFAQWNIKHLGVEPSKNVADVAIKKGIHTICDFFSTETATKIENNYGKADVIVGTNVMCHIPYIHSVFDGANHLLKPKGVLIFEDPYMGDIVRRVSYDQIYDEHAFYFSATSVSYLAEMHGMQIVDLTPTKTHGGSMRYVIGRKGMHTVSPIVKSIQQLEDEMGLHKDETYKILAENIKTNRSDLMQLLRQLKSKGNRIVGYGATSKSTTVTNFCGIREDLVEFISDTTPIKQNKYNPGTHIPIKDYDSFLGSYPDYALLFAWNHADEIIEKEKRFVAAGGKFIVYVDEVKIIGE